MLSPVFLPLTVTDCDVAEAPEIAFPLSSTGVKVRVAVAVTSSTLGVSLPLSALLLGAAEVGCC